MIIPAGWPGWEHATYAQRTAAVEAGLRARLSQREIARRLRCTKNAVSRWVTRYILRDEEISAAMAERATRKATSTADSMSDETRQAILDAYAAGTKQLDIADKHGVPLTTVKIVLRLARRDGDRRAAKRISEAQRQQAREVARQNNGSGRIVPKWARDAGLAVDYLQYARMWGEEAAASACRKLKRDMTQGFAG